MQDQIMALYQIVIQFLTGLNIHDFLYDYWEEVAGCAAIIILLFIVRSIRKRRNRKKADSAQSDKTPAVGDETDTAQPVEMAESIEMDEAVSELMELEPDSIVEVASSQGLETELESPDDIVVPDLEEVLLPTAEEIAEEEAIAVPEPEKPKTGVSFLDRLKSGLSKTRQSLSRRFDTILSGNRKIDDDVLEEIEEVLITSDIGVPTTMELMQRIEQNADNIKTADEFKSQLKEEMLSLVNIDTPVQITEKPHIIMVVGVNGVGKTTTIGKLAAKFSAQGKKVLLSASDTFRAAAVEQLQIWADRSSAEIVKHRDKSDPAAVAFDSIEAALARDVDIVIVDTAGRLHTKVNLMEELKKIKRSISKKIPTAPHETFLVLDATTGQNAVSQAKLFNENIDISGIILTKLDGTAKGGIVLSICDTLNIPIRYIGIGEGIDDLQEFDPKLFVDALL